MKTPATCSTQSMNASIGEVLQFKNRFHFACVPVMDMRLPLDDSNHSKRCIPMWICQEWASFMSDCLLENTSRNVCPAGVSNLECIDDDVVVVGLVLFDGYNFYYGSLRRGHLVKDVKWSDDILLRFMKLLTTVIDMEYIISGLPTPPQLNTTTSISADSANISDVCIKGDNVNQNGPIASHVSPTLADGQNSSAVVNPSIPTAAMAMISSFSTVSDLCISSHQNTNFLLTQSPNKTPKRQAKGQTKGQSKGQTRLQVMQSIGHTTTPSKTAFGCKIDHLVIRKPKSVTTSDDCSPIMTSNIALDVVFYIEELRRGFEAN